MRERGSKEGGSRKELMVELMEKLTKELIGKLVEELIEKLVKELIEGGSRGEARQK